jgi:hypothetical protein
MPGQKREARFALDDPGIHAFSCALLKEQDVDGRVKPGHDEMG